MNKRKISKLWIVAVVGLVWYFSYILIGQQKELFTKRAEMSDLQAKIEQGEKLKKVLLKQNDDINSNEYVEKVAREELGMIKPGEKVFIDVNK